MIQRLLPVKTTEILLLVGHVKRVKQLNWPCSSHAGVAHLLIIIQLTSTQSSNHQHRSVLEAQTLHYCPAQRNGNVLLQRKGAHRSASVTQEMFNLKCALPVIVPLQQRRKTS